MYPPWRGQNFVETRLMAHFIFGLSSLLSATSLTMSAQSIARWNAIPMSRPDTDTQEQAQSVQNQTNSMKVLCHIFWHE